MQIFVQPEDFSYSKGKNDERHVLYSSLYSDQVLDVTTTKKRIINKQ